MDRLWALEQFVAQLRAALNALTRRVTAAEQAAAQAASQSGQQGGSSGLIVAVITSSVTAGTEASPTTFNATIEVPSGATGFTTSGGTAITGYNRFPGIAFTVTGSKGAWLTQQGNGKYYLVSADC